jgi:hypothetical protein
MIIKESQGLYLDAATAHSRYLNALTEMRAAYRDSKSSQAKRRARRKVRYWEKKAHRERFMQCAYAKLFLNAHPDLTNEHIGGMCKIEESSATPLGAEAGVIVGRLLSLPGDGTAIVEIN